jgi:peptidyl-tRNA hydrolase, PTH2 family
MSPGKIASQAGHAYLDSYLKALELCPAKAQEYKQDSHGIKVCLRAKSLHELEKAHALAIQMGIPCALITDLGYTCFDGVPTITALGLGPARKAEIEQITKKFQLMK